jgi:hypothetical protein
MGVRAGNRRQQSGVGRQKSCAIHPPGSICLFLTTITR